MRKNDDTCCKGCRERSRGCWSTCARYIKWKAAIEAEKRAIYEARKDYYNYYNYKKQAICNVPKSRREAK